MISKALLSEVLKETIREVYKIRSNSNFEQNTLLFKLYGSGELCHINIYELAHKCKEWAVNLSPNKHALSSYPRWGDIRNYKKTNGSYYISQHLVSGAQFEAETEPEAIFKACQWILDKDSK